MFKIKDNEWADFRNHKFTLFGYKKKGKTYYKSNDIMGVQITKQKIATYPLTHIEGYYKKEKEILQDLIQAGLVEKVGD